MYLNIEAWWLSTVNIFISQFLWMDTFASTFVLKGVINLAIEGMKWKWILECINSLTHPHCGVSPTICLHMILLTSESLWRSDVLIANSPQNAYLLWANIYKHVGKTDPENTHKVDIIMLLQQTTDCRFSMFWAPSNWCQGDNNTYLY